MVYISSSRLLAQYILYKLTAALLKKTGLYPGNMFAELKRHLPASRLGDPLYTMLPLRMVTGVCVHSRHKRLSCRMCYGRTCTIITATSGKHGSAHQWMPFPGFGPLCPSTLRKVWWRVEKEAWGSSCLSRYMLTMFL
jgi:hypothetical protein